MDEFQGRNKKDEVEAIDFENLWPSETSGDGKVVRNNAKTGSGQGKASFVRKAKCRQCGFPTDLNQNATDGGTLDGNGAGGGISTSTYTATYPNGTTHTESGGTQTYNQGSGCPLCFSANASNEKLDLTFDVNLDSLPRAGF